MQWRRVRRDALGARLAHQTGRSLATNPGASLSLPGYGTLLFDDRGCLWAQRLQLPEATSVTWDVVDPTGEWIPSADLEPPFTLESISNGTLVGRTKGEWGIGRSLACGCRRDQPFRRAGFLGAAAPAPRAAPGLPCQLPSRGVRQTSVSSSRRGSIRSWQWPPWF